jgi:ATP-dependent DNA ligase
VLAETLRKWRKAKCLNRQEFVVVGWTDPEGSRPHLGALLLGYYTDDGKLIYAGRVGTGMSEKVLKDLRRRLDPVKRAKSPLSVTPPRSTRFGSPLVLSRVHWVEPKLVAEITYLTWTADELGSNPHGSPRRQRCLIAACGQHQRTPPALSCDVHPRLFPKIKQPFMDMH